MEIVFDFLHLLLDASFDPRTSVCGSVMAEVGTVEEAMVMTSRMAVISHHGSAWYHGNTVVAEKVRC